MLPKTTKFNVFDMLGQLEDLVNCFEIDLTVFLKGGARNCECRMFEMDVFACGFLLTRLFGVDRSAKSVLKKRSDMFQQLFEQFLLR